MGDLQLVHDQQGDQQRVFVYLDDGRAIWGMDLATRQEWWYQPDEVERRRAELTVVLASLGVGSATTSDPPPYHDLASNRPGQAARQRAEEELAAMKARSRVGTWLARAVDAKTDERAWRVGADGEETIGAKLDKLVPHGFYVLHAVPVGNRGSDIDHVVIGPPGVYTVNTKKHPGKKVWVGGSTIMVDGQRKPYVRNSEHEAERASRLLSAAAGFPVVVKPVLIFTTGTLIPDVTIKSKPKNVVVLDRMDVPRIFKRGEKRLTPDQVDAIYDVARRSTTWVTP